MKKLGHLLFILGVIPHIAQHAYTFETSTHRELSRHAVSSSNLDNFLRTQLGHSGGINEPFTGETDEGTETMAVSEWVQLGSVREDDGVRFLNHFHNPLKGWAQAGLGLAGGKSSILWAQDPGQGYAWKDARDSYFDALTATTQAEREEKFAKTFRALGQLIHFVQDAAVPAHTRNDPHPPWNRDALERFTDTSPNLLPVATLDSLVGTPIPFNPSVLECTPNGAAPVRIACITDTTDSEQSQATPSAGTNQGMAEYTNSNFLSRDTIFKNFTFPRIESLDLINPLILGNRRYYTKIADGEMGFFLAAEGSFTDRLLSLSWFDKGFMLDPLVTLDYAAKLFPRAVGYSAGLIDYFFRGNIDGIGGCGIEVGPNPVEVTNYTASETAGSGEMVAIVSYTLSGQRQYIASLPVQVNLTTPQNVVFHFQSAPPWNAQAPGFQWLIFRGQLGNEADAVIVGLFGGPC